MICLIGDEFPFILNSIGLTLKLSSPTLIARNHCIPNNKFYYFHKLQMYYLIPQMICLTKFV